MEPGILAAFATLLTPLTGLALYIGNLYRQRIAALEQMITERDQVIVHHEAREKRIVAVLLRSAEDEERLTTELAKVIGGDDRV